MQFKETRDEGCKGNHSSAWPTAALPRFIFFCLVSGFVQFEFWMSQKQMQIGLTFHSLSKFFCSNSASNFSIRKNLDFS